MEKKILRKVEVLCSYNLLQFFMKNIYRSWDQEILLKYGFFFFFAINAGCQYSNLCFQSIAYNSSMNVINWKKKCTELAFYISFHDMYEFLIFLENLVGNRLTSMLVKSKILVEKKSFYGERSYIITYMWCVSQKV